MKLTKQLLLATASKLAAAFLLTAGSAGGAFAMDLIVCTVASESAAGPDDIDRRLCGRVADTLGALRVSSGELEEAISGKTPKDVHTRLHVLEASIVSPHAISARYAVGTADDWRKKREKQFDQLQIDVMDASINDASLTLLAETIRRLAELAPVRP